jgi:CO dehydrogenase/acetyl-CoA synthase gamma subunit (corrinoid Fe-S protein)
MSKTQKILKTGEATQNIANTEKKVEEKKTIASVAQQRLANLEKREKRLVEIVEKRTATISKMQKNLDIFKVALEKVKAQKAAELQSIKELTETFSKGSA